METTELIAAERRRIAALLEGLTSDQWAAPSLCEKWTVRDVAAHLTLPFRVGLGRMAWEAIRRGGLDPATDRLSRQLAEQPTAALVKGLRDNAETKFKPPFVPLEAPLSDTVIHGLDITRPLGLPDGADPEAVTRVLGFLTTKMATRGFVPKTLLPGLRLEATDVDWSHGDGPVVRGTAASLALAIAGRGSSAAALDGDGADEFRRRLAAAGKK
jgi:uncharacterized protein (TIGR03083 family)